VKVSSHARSLSVCVRVHTEFCVWHTGTSLISRISTALADHRHTDALVLLSEARIRGVQPKLGALQRWVRDCDAASRSDGSFGDDQVLRVLDAILRCTNGDQDVDWEWPGMKTGKGAVVRQDDWKVREASSRDIWAEIKAGSFPREPASFEQRHHLLELIVFLPTAVSEREALSKRFYLRKLPHKVSSLPRTDLSPPHS
jgi:hypothetical protein